MIRERIWRAESIPIGPRKPQIPQAVVRSDKITEQSTDRGGDLEVKDDGPY